MSITDELIESLPLIKARLEELRKEANEVSWSDFIDLSIKDAFQRAEVASVAYSRELKRISDDIESLSIAYEEGRKQKAIKNALNLIK